MRVIMAKNKKGFTLVELVVVICILAVMAAIAIPSLTGYIKSSQEKKAISDATVMLSAIQMYVNEVYPSIELPANYTDTIEDYIDDNMFGNGGSAMNQFYDEYQAENIRFRVIPGSRVERLSGSVLTGRVHEVETTPSGDVTAWGTVARFQYINEDNTYTVSYNKNRDPQFVAEKSPAA